MTDYDGAIVRLQVGTTGWTETAGMGMLADSDHVVTCAHVVNTALGRGPREQDRPGGDAVVRLDFPYVAEPPPVRHARVMDWKPPPSTGVSGGDLAVLQLTEPAPVGFVTGALSPTPPRVGKKLRVFGYQDIRSDGTWVDLEFKGTVRRGAYQVESCSDQTFKAQPGYSGSPVWDDDTKQAIGLLNATPFAEEPYRDAYILPASDVAEFLKSLNAKLLIEVWQRMQQMPPEERGPAPAPSDEEGQPCAARSGARQGADGMRRWAMMADARGLWEVVPGDAGPEIRPIASEADADVSWLRSVPASLALSSDARVVGQLSHGLLSLAWVDRIAPRLDRWSKPFELQLDGDDARLLAVSVEFGDDVICLISTDQATYRAEVAPSMDPVTTRIADSASRCAAFVAGTPIVIDHVGRQRGTDLDLRQHRVAEVNSLDAARSGGRAAYAMVGLDADGQPCIAETCSTGTLTLLPGVSADEVLVVRQLSAGRAPTLAVLVNDGRLTRIPRGDRD